VVARNHHKDSGIPLVGDNMLDRSVSPQFPYLLFDDVLWVNEMKKDNERNFLDL
jgi:hypothetical protein